MNDLTWPVSSEYYRSSLCERSMTGPCTGPDLPMRRAIDIDDMSPSAVRVQARPGLQAFFGV